MSDRIRAALAVLAGMDDNKIDTISDLQLDSDVLEEIAGDLRSNIQEVYANGFVKPDALDEAVTTVVELVLPDDEDERLRHFSHIGAAQRLTPSELIYDANKPMDNVLTAAVESAYRAGVGELFVHIETQIGKADSGGE